MGRHYALPPSAPSPDPGGRLAASAMRLIAASVVTALVLPPLPSQQMQKESVPFVGCPTSVQGHLSDGHHGAPVVVELDHATAQQLAFYKGDVGHGAFAHRCWHCGSWAVSATITLSIRP